MINSKTLKFTKCKKIKNFDKNQVTDILFTILVFITIIIIIINPKKYSSGTIEGLKLFFYSVLPGLFPFMLLTKILTEIGIVEKFFSKFDRLTYFLFGTPGISLYTLFVSILSGYPIGSKVISDLYNKQIISEDDAKKMSIFCTTSGPSFVIGTIGTIMFDSYKFGVIIYFSHILSSILLGIIFNILCKNKHKHIKKEKNFDKIKQKNIIGYCINETISSLLIVGSYITIFYLIGELLDTINVFMLLQKISNPIFSILSIDKKYISGILYGILEVTRGSKVLSAFSNNFSVVLTTGILSFSGLSIIFQSMAFLKQAKIKTHNFIISKCAHCLLSMILCFLLLRFF